MKVKYGARTGKSKTQVEKDLRNIRSGLRSLMNETIDVDIEMNSDLDVIHNLQLMSGDEIQIIVRGAVTQEMVDEKYATGEAEELAPFASVS